MEKKEEILCPVNCPFLSLRSFLPNTMPFYCGRYDTYLGFSPAKKVLKCALCRGKTQDIVQVGLSLLETQGKNSAELKQAFLKMLPPDQKKLVSFLSSFGTQLSFHTNKITPFLLNTQIQKQMRLRHQYESSQEHLDFVKLLKLIGESGTPIEGNTQSLLSNLFQVIDRSEKGILLAIMENPAHLKAFLKQFSKIPQDQNMLKNFRSVLYDFDRQMQIQQPQRIQMQHLLNGMNRIRLARARQRQKTRE